MRYALLIFICLMGEYAAAQREIYFGFKGGVNFRSPGGTGEDVDNPVGFHFGGVGAIRKARHAFQLELIVSEHQQTVSYYPKKTSHFWYVNLPVIYKRYLGRKGFNLQSGLQYGVLAYGYGITGYESSTPFEAIMGRVSLPASALLSAALGCGWDFAKGPSIDLRYNAGLTDRHTNSQGWFNRNFTIQLSVGYQFSRKRQNT